MHSDKQYEDTSQSCNVLPIVLYDLQVFDVISNLLRILDWTLPSIRCGGQIN